MIENARLHGIKIGWGPFMRNVSPNGPPAVRCATDASHACDELMENVRLRRRNHGENAAYRAYRRTLLHKPIVACRIKDHNAPERRPRAVRSENATECRTEPCGYQRAAHRKACWADEAQSHSIQDLSVRNDALKPPKEALTQNSSQNDSPPRVWKLTARSMRLSKPSPSPFDLARSADQTLVRVHPDSPQSICRTGTNPARRTIAT